jgi:multidrug efflux pump subunit AcrA (membrane-fusion protein)
VRPAPVKARRRTQLSTEIGGRVVAIPHRKGERMAAGEVVLRLYDSVQRARLRRRPAGGAAAVPEWAPALAIPGG